MILTAPRPSEEVPVISRFIASLFRSRAGATRPADNALFEGLEQRLALYADPFLADLPELSAMKNTNDTVVRFQTNHGIIDIEIYDRGGPPARVTAQNFLTYVTSGRYDNTFFHRSISNFVLQGGGFVDDPTSSPQYSAVTTDPAIVNEYSNDRKNLVRTIAMAKLGGQPNSATSQFFFNLVDNPDLDTQNGGFTVFGKVIKGWDIVETIAGFQTRDLNTFLGGDAFGQVPLSNANDNTSLIRIIDAEIIKPADQLAFYTQTIYFPEGFRSGRIVSTVNLVNEDANASALYQVIVRYETKTRDTVISTGTLVPGAHLELPISKAGTPSLNLVKAGAPFAYIIRSTAKVGATLIHKDFGATASESFFQAEPFDAEALKSWSFAGAQKSPGVFTYFVWENLTGSVATVTINFYAADGSTVLLTKTTQPYRRGGIDLSQITNLANGLVTARITSTQPIVASMSLYRAAPARATIELGVPKGGNTQGILPGAIIASTGQAVITAMRTSDSIASSVTIDFQFILSDGSVLSNNGTLTLPSGTRSRRWDLSTLNAALPADEAFTIRYKVRSATEPLAVSYYSLGAGGDAVAEAFQTFSSQELLFAGGFTDPTDTGREIISIVNPYTSGTVVANYRLRFHFADGTSDEIIIPPGGSGSLTQNRRLDISVRDLPEVMARITSDAKFRTYSITLSTTLLVGGREEDGAIFASLTRIDPANGTVAIGPTLRAGSAVFFANDAIFTPA